MTLIKSKIINKITLVLTLAICLFSAFVSVSLLLSRDIPLHYQMLGSFYSCIIMKDIGEWIPEAKGFIEYFWIVLTFVYVFGKIIFVAVAECVNFKKRMIGLMIPICLIFLIDVPAWLYTAHYWHDILGWAISGAVIRVSLICGNLFIVYCKKKESISGIKL